MPNHIELRIAAIRGAVAKWLWIVGAVIAVLVAIGRVGYCQEDDGNAAHRISWNILEKQIFGDSGDAAAGREQLEKLMAHRLEGVDRTCSLSALQAEKLRLAGRGDVKRFFDRVDQLRQTARGGLDRAAYREACLEAATLRRNYRSAFTGSSSLLAKAIKRNLTPEQFAKYRGSEFDWRSPVTMSPNRIPLGTVYVGAMVEASVRIIFEGDVAPGVDVRTEDPDWVRTKRTATGTQAHGAFGLCTFCDVFLEFDTSRAGNFDGNVTVIAGDDAIELPITVAIREREQPLTRLLVVETPFHRQSTGDASMFDPWLKLVEEAALDAHYLDLDQAGPALRNVELSRFDVILFDAGALVKAGEEDLDRLSKFARSGGRVLLTADHFFRGSVPKANALVTPFGLTMHDRELYAEVQINQGGIVADPFTREVRKLRFFRPSSVSRLDGADARILVEVPDDSEQGYIAAAPADQGEVIILGSSLWWNWIADDPKKGSSNGTLLRNLLTRTKAD